MPGNTIKVNRSNELEWYVGDSKMEGLMEWLDKNGEKIKNEKDLTKMERLQVWVDRLIFPGDSENFIQVLKTFKNDDEEVKEICFYTNDHRYRIYAVDRNEDDGYLGCQVSARKMRPGEDWIRGNDLADGSFDKKTWDRILNSIVNYELLQLSNFTKPEGRPEGIEVEV